jgi:prevent-host-death family protein
MSRKPRACATDVNVADGIVPIGEFKAQAARYLRELQAKGEPIVITQNGRPVAVVMSPSAFEDIRAEREYLEAIARGIEDADEGRLVAQKKVRQWLQTWGTKAESQPPR